MSSQGSCQARLPSPQSEAAFPTGDPGVGTIVSGGLCVYPRSMVTCVRLENHLSPTLHPEVDTEGAAAHTEWESWRVVPPSPPPPPPGVATWRARATERPLWLFELLQRVGRCWGCLHLSLPGCDLFRSSFLRLLRAVSAVVCGGHIQELSDRRAFLWVSGCEVGPGLEPGG